MHCKNSKSTFVRHWTLKNYPHTPLSKATWNGGGADSIVTKGRVSWIILRNVQIALRQLKNGILQNESKVDSPLVSLLLAVPISYQRQGSMGCMRSQFGRVPAPRNVRSGNKMDFRSAFLSRVDPPFVLHKQENSIIFPWSMGLTWQSWNWSAPHVRLMAVVPRHTARKATFPRDTRSSSVISEFLLL